MKKIFSKSLIYIYIVCFGQLANASVLYSQPITLSPGWNIVSTPKVLESHTFSASETSDNFDIYTLNASSTTGWSTLADLGQTTFVPLFGYFVNNKTGTDQTLTFNYKDTSPSEQFFERTFSKAGWYSIGIANSTYAKNINSDDTDINNPDNVLNSLLGAFPYYGTVIDFTDASYETDKNSVGLADPWKGVSRSPDLTNSTEINTLNDLRETKGYAIYIKEPSARYSGFQDNTLPQCSDVIDNDGDGLIDLNDDGCQNSLDNDESLIILNSHFEISKTSDSPAAQIVIVDDSEDTNDVVLLKGKIENTGDSSILIDSFPFTLTTAGGANVSAVTGSITLKIGSDEFTESVSITGATTGTVTFDNLDFTIDDGATVNFEVLADINDIDAGNLDEGDTLKAEVTSTNRDYIDAKNEEGDQLDDVVDKSGTAIGAVQEFRTAGIKVALVSKGASVIAGPNSDDDQGVFIFRFKVEALGGSAYIPSIDAVNFEVVHDGAIATSGISAGLTNSTDSNKTFIGNYEIEEGEVEAFNLEILAQLPDAGTNGQYRARITDIKWDTNDSVSPANLYSYGLDEFETIGELD